MQPPATVVRSGFRGDPAGRVEGHYVRRLFLCLFVCSPALAAEGPEFVTDVLPLLETKCFGCHGTADKTEGGLDLTTLEASLKGGDSGPALVPGDPDASPLYLATHAEPEEFSAMPPQERNRLSDAERETLAAWIRGGATWTDPAEWTPGPTTEDSATTTVATSGGLSPTWDNRPYAVEDLWAWQPVTRPDVPEGADHPIDAFLLRKLREAGVEDFAPEADRRTLLRRLSLDLTGLPPEPEDVEAAAKADAFDYEAAVDRLLASKHYGEQMARHWLDVVRYADTGGFANDFERPNLWRYRDYVIRSFNADKPFDEFVVEQIAGDELDESDPENLIAVGFLRSGPWEHTGMSVAAVTRQQFLDDVTHGVGVTFLGQGLRCASCHDHKFDPVPTRDYYRVQAVFAPVQFAHRDVPFLPEENTANFDRLKETPQRLLKEAKDLQRRMNEKNKKAVEALLAERGLKSLEEIPADERPDKGRVGLTDHEQSLKKIAFKAEAYHYRRTMRDKPKALSVYSGPDRLVKSNFPTHDMPEAEKRTGPAAETAILTGGSIESPSEPVDPGVLSAMAGANDRVTPTAWNTIPEGVTGRRLAFARWVASPQNTLTARVVVNRAWQRHFGTGLVDTPNNFGVTGSKPTHPQLLDYLATWFVDNGWSLKKLDRLIVTSRAYRQASDRPGFAAVEEADPANRLLSRFPVRRLAAEEIRDAMLAVTGELNPEMGGPGVFPKINWEVAMQPRHIMGSVAPAYTPSVKKSDRDRRTVYAFRFRTLSDPFLEVFNKPVAETSCERRDETTVATQALTLINSQFTRDRAVALADRIAKQSGDAAEQARRAFRRTLLRDPTGEELAAAVSHLEAMRAEHAEAEPKRPELPKSVHREMIEELTGEPVEWDEELIGLEGYEPDLAMADLEADGRALAELCLVLLNSNEFVYVR